MGKRTATAQTSRDLKSAALATIATGVVWPLLPIWETGVPLSPRLLSAAPLVTVGVTFLVLATSRVFLLDRLCDEVDRLNGEVAARLRMPEFTVAEIGTYRETWTKLPFSGLSLVALGLSVVVGGLSGAENGGSWSGSAVGLIAAGLVISTIGWRLYNRHVSQKSHLVVRLQTWLADGPDSETEAK